MSIQGFTLQHPSGPGYPYATGPYPSIISEAVREDPEQYPSGPRSQSQGENTGKQPGICDVRPAGYGRNRHSRKSLPRVSQQRSSPRDVPGDDAICGAEQFIHLPSEFVRLDRRFREDRPDPLQEKGNGPSHDGGPIPRSSGTPRRTSPVVSKFCTGQVSGR